MHRRAFLGKLAALATALTVVVPSRATSRPGSRPGSPAVSPEAAPAIDVFKNPSCGCCTAWVEHLREHGFVVRVHESTDLAAVRRRLGLADALASCHTASVAGYALEGHVPAADIRRLLARRPAAVGLAVPGMPMGAPGMQAGAYTQPYDVLLVDATGATRVFAHYAG
jgi:hypothetical protein